jgi:hypothetical protein
LLELKMLRFGLLVIFWALFFMLVLFVEAMLLTATQQDMRRTWLSRNARSTRAQGRIREWWSTLTIGWRRFFIVAVTGLALSYGLLVGATVTQALAGDLGKFWAVLVGLGISCWIAAILAMLRLDERDEPDSDEESQTA